MKKILFLFSLVFLISSCVKEDDVIDKSDRVVLAYFVANNNLSSDLKSNILSMYDGMLSLKKESTLLIFWDGTSSDNYFNNPCIIKYVANGNGEVNGMSGSQTVDQVLKNGRIVKQYSSLVSTDSIVMARVLNDMISLSNADKYGIIFGSHATGWLKASTRSFGQDGESYNSMNMPAMSYALSCTHHKFDFIFFDACLMGNIETCYELRNNCEYIVASPNEVPGQGFPYSKLMRYLYSNDSLDYTKNICNTIGDYFRDQDLWGTYIAVKTDGLNNLSMYYKNLLMKNSSEISNVNNNEVQHYATYKYGNMNCDIKDYFINLTNGNVPQTLLDQLNKTIVACNFVHHGTKYKNFAPLLKDNTSDLCGLGMYIPYNSDKSEYTDYFKTLSWSSASGWNDFLAGN